MSLVCRRLIGLSVMAVLFGSPAAGLAQEFPKPGPEHELLKQLEGEWDAHTKLMEPGKPAEESKGTYTAKMDVGGLFLVTDFKGKMFGQPFRGHGISGYNPHKKKYTGVWVDSMSPAIYQTEGTFDKAGKVLTDIMEGPDPMTGKTMKMRMTTEIKDKDQIVFRIFSFPEEGKDDKDGKEQLMIEITYTRKK
jgi:hypothetical protein